MHPPSFFVAGWAVSGECRSAEILGAHKILTELLRPCLSVCLARNSLAATRRRFDFIYTEMAARRKIDFFPKRFLSWGFKTLFASTSSCQCQPPLCSSPAGLCPMNLDPPGSSGRTRFWTELLCPASSLVLSRISMAATRRRFDFIYTEMAARQKIGRSWGSNPGPHDFLPRSHLCVDKIESPPSGR